jgi:O-antigen biosynthesis protein WbqP
LDELPQLINIIRGEMSFLGPRPALPSQTDVIGMRQESGADQIRPGISGLAQVMGRDDLDNKTKVAYDTDYARNLSLFLDLKILALTFVTVVSARGNK